MTCGAPTTSTSAPASSSRSSSPGIRRPASSRASRAQGFKTWEEVHLLAERMVVTLNDPKNYPAFVSEDRRQIPKTIFLREPGDSMAKPGPPTAGCQVLDPVNGER